MENKIWILLARQLTGEASVEELEELRKILTKDPVFAKVANEIKKTRHVHTSDEMDKALSSFAKIDAEIHSRKLYLKIDKCHLKKELMFDSFLKIKVKSNWRLSVSFSNKILRRYRNACL